MMIGMLAWLGFLISAAIHADTFFGHTIGMGAMVMQFLCIGLMLVAQGMKGFRRKLQFSDCGGLARPLLFFVSPYCTIVFLLTLFGHHDKHEPVWVTMRMFSAVWMSLFLFCAGVMAKPGRS